MTELFLELIKMSLIGALFAAGVMAVRLVFRKAPKWIFVALWGVVALRLILPVSLESKLSLVPDSLATGQAITHVSDAYVGPVDIVYEQDTNYHDALQAGRQPIHSEQGNYIVTQKDSVEAPKTFGETVLPVLGWVWLAGVALMLTYAAASYFLLKGKMAVATHLQENIWQCEKADMPFVLGVFHPKIYLPYGLTSRDTEYVIAHEQAHIARRDHWWKPLGFLLLSVHWFNPVLWLAYILLCRDIEAACDEKVIGPMEKEAIRAYSTALLNCSVHRRRIAACPLAFGETGVKERIKRIMNYKKPTFWIILIAIIICVTTVICFGTNPLKRTENPNPTETEATEQTENKDNFENKNTENTDKDNTGTGSIIGKEATAAEMIARHTTVLTGPVTQYVQVDNSRTVTYTDLSNQEVGIPVSLPKFLPFSDDAIACQAGLEKDLEFELQSVAEAVASKTDSSVFYINFEAWLNGDILSVVIRSEASYDYRTYYTYNFDVTTGKRLSREDLVQKLQITNLDGRLEQTAKNGFETKYGPVNGTYEFATLQLNATMHSANLKNAQLYVGRDGKLMSVVYIHAIAGAAGYYEQLPVSDQQAENTEATQPEITDAYFTRADFRSLVVGKSLVGEVLDAIAPRSMPPLHEASYGLYCDFPLEEGGYIRIAFYEKDGFPILVGSIEDVPSGANYVHKGSTETIGYTNLSGRNCIVKVERAKILPFSDDAIACQKELDATYQTILTEVREKVAQSNDAVACQIGYEAILNGDTLSLTIKAEYDVGDDEVFAVYHFNVATGKRLDQSPS